MSDIDYTKFNERMRDNALREIPEFRAAAARAIEEADKAKVQVQRWEGIANTVAAVLSTLPPANNWSVKEYRRFMKAMTILRKGPVNECSTGSA